jgi:catalase
MQHQRHTPTRLLLAVAAAAAATGHASAQTSMPMAAAMADAAPAASAVSPIALVDALNGVFGKHSARSSHAKGVCMAGYFEAAPAASAITSAKMFQVGQRTPLIGRFSVGGGNPKAPDNAKSVRGIAVRAGEGADRMEWIFISAPHFFAQTPAQFVEFMKVRAPDPTTGKMNPDAIAAFGKANPATTRQAAYLASQPVPASFATVPYWSTSAFIATNAAGKTQALRWRFEPVAGRLGLSDDEAKAKGADFLRAELSERLNKGAVVFSVMAQLAQPQDQLLDPTDPWPSDRAEVNMGRLVIDRATDQACDRETFIPTVLPSGIAASADPTLAVRAASYAVSLSRR